MKIHTIAFLSALASFGSLAQAQDTANADPACVITNADGSKTLDTMKCKDGKVLGNAETTGSTSQAPATTATSVIVPAESIAGGRIVTASDFLGKSIYAPDGTRIGEVNDFFVTPDGKVQAVVLGVGGFLGIGEKNVAVAMQAIQTQGDGTDAKLVINSSKDELTAAPTYDSTKRVYVK